MIIILQLSKLLFREVKKLAKARVQMGPSD